MEAKRRLGYSSLKAQKIYLSDMMRVEFVHDLWQVRGYEAEAVYSAPAPASKNVPKEVA